jgi:hypothetical protein
MFLKRSLVRAAIIALALVASISMAHSTYTGYSGAPGSSGTCASSCHGTTGGTITATGFPTAYTPGANYVITVGHTGTASISNFNGSCRVGTTSTKAGTIVAGTGTTVYNVSTETNGVHFTTAGNQTSGTFTWTAPAKGTGTAKLYVAGIQTGSSGPNTAIVQTSTENTTSVISSGSRNTSSMTLNLFAGHKAVIALPDGFMPSKTESFSVFDTRGSEIHVSVTSTGASLIWNGVDINGRALSAGTYIFVLRQGQVKLTGRILLTR